MRPLNTVEERDRALLLLRRARVWIAAGAVGLTGVASAAAAATFRGHHATTPAAATAQPRPAPSGSDAIPLPPSAADEDQGLQAPQEPPQPAPPADSQPPASSGGS